MSYTFLDNNNTITLDTINLVVVRDLFNQQRIMARIQGLSSPIILWNGSDEYTAAGNWTNDSATQRAIDLITNGTAVFQSMGTIAVDLVPSLSATTPTTTTVVVSSTNVDSLSS